MEYAKIVATYYNLTGSSLVDKSLKERGYSEAQIAAMQKNNFKTIRFNNLILKPGFEKLHFENFDFYYALFNQYEKGVLPFKGPLVDQPNKIIELFGVLQSLNTEQEKIARKEQERQMKKRK